MKPPYFIETLARNGEVQSRQRVERLPVRLGRGYDNDLILDDAHVAAQHAVIEAHGDGLCLRDLGSRNGAICQGRRQALIALGNDTVVRLGHTHVRVRGADCAVAPELADTALYAWEGATPALSGLALIALSAALGSWLGDAAASDLVHYLLVLAYGLGGGLLWSAMWAFGNRLFGGRARLGRHLFILGCGLLGLEAWQALSSVLAYAYSLEWLTRYGNHILIALACGMVYFHLCTITPQRTRRCALACVLLMLLGSGLNLIGNLQLNGRLGDELYMTVLLPPALRQSPDHSVDEFFGRAAALQAAADAERAAKVRGAALLDDEQD